MNDKETRDRIRKVKRYGLITAGVFVVVIPTSMILLLISLFTGKEFDTPIIIANMILNFTTVVFMVYSSIFIKDNGGWGTSRSLKLLKVPFFIIVIFNMCMLANNLIKLIQTNYL